jgi:glycosyltransferase involved in cell wall biosynthesis
MSIDIILPCLNEADALPWVMRRIPVGTRAIVVDNGSTDGSAELAAALAATVVTCATRGYGAACITGLAAASADVVAFCDCDGTLDPRDIPRIALALDHADLVIGRRRPVQAVALSPSARIANLVVARRVSRRIGYRLRDIGPLRIARRDALHSLDVDEPRFGYPVETVLRAAAAGWTLAEVDVDYHRRLGRSKVTGTAGGFVRAVRDVSAVLAS